MALTENEKVFTVLGLLLLGAGVAYAVTPKTITDLARSKPTDLDNGGAVSDGTVYGNPIDTGGTPVNVGADEKCPCPTGFMWQNNNACYPIAQTRVPEGLATMFFENGNVVLKAIDPDSGFRGDNGKEMCEKTYKGSWANEKCTIKIPEGYNLRMITQTDISLDGSKTYDYRLVCKK